ncbi:MAG: DNA cytosine methyltransferase [Candidatus Omnitrophica bacterium]|nr:DNA cytosine methyltransferase [Candidatus Omnitrophota bacterium]
MSAYYNEFKPEAAAMLRQLIKDGLIADGDVDERSITEVKADELRGYTQCHFFAGIGGWSVALRLAGWPDDKPVWTGSCPCQPFSKAGKGKAQKDERHLWPVWFNLIRECKPTEIFGEQVDKAIAHGWLDGVYADLESEAYSIGSSVLPAGSVNSPQKRYRTWFVAKSDSYGDCGEVGGIHEAQDDKALRDGSDIFIAGQPGGAGEDVHLLGKPIVQGYEGHGRLKQKPISQGRQGEERYSPSAGFWDEYDWIVGGDGKARRIPAAHTGICILDHGIQHRAPLLHAFGNAIVPEVAARFIKASM